MAAAEEEAAAAGRGRAQDQAAAPAPAPAPAPDALNGDSFKKPFLPLTPLQKKEKTFHSSPSSSSTEATESVKSTEVPGGEEAAAVEDLAAHEQGTGSESEGKSTEDQKLVESQPPKPTLPLTKPRSIPRLPSDSYKPCPPLPYVEPPWGGLAEAPYSFEVLKNGGIASVISLNRKSFYVVGRLPACDIALEHPSISRYHAVVQHRRAAEGGSSVGFYVYDLGSTHGTVVNKERVEPNCYHRLKVGHVIKFGGSTRLLILQGPEEDEEAESEFTMTEMKQMNRQHKRLEKRMLGEDSDEEDDAMSESVEQPRKPVGKAASGCSWGIVEDAVEDESEENPYSIEFQEDQEAFYIKDPKKALQGFFDREGEELEYEYDEQGSGTWICRVRLPVTDALGKELVAEVAHAGKKKEAMVQCSLEACKILEARGVLRMEAVSRKRKSKNWEAEDFYDSDEDTFLDRTGAIEKKRLNRMKKAGKIEEKADTYDSLVAKLADLERKLRDIEENLKISGKDSPQAVGEDSLEAFMTDIKMGAAMDSVTRKKLHVESFELKKEQQRLRKLIKIVTPVDLPELKIEIGGQTGDPGAKPRKISVPMFGAMKGGKKFKLKTGTVGILPPKRPEPPSSLFNMKGSQAFEVEEDEEEEAASNKNKPGGRSQDQELELESDPSHISDSSKSRGRNNERALTTLCPEEDKGEGSGAQSLKKQEDHQDLPAEDLSPVITESKDVESQRKPMKKKIYGRRKALLPERYPSGDPDYCVWMPPTGQTGDGRTHLNDKYGY